MNSGWWTCLSVVDVMWTRRRSTSSGNAAGLKKKKRSRGWRCRWRCEAWSKWGDGNWVTKNKAIPDYICSSLFPSPPSDQSIIFNNVFTQEFSSFLLKPAAFPQHVLCCLVHFTPTTRVGLARSAGAPGQRGPLFINYSWMLITIKLKHIIGLLLSATV